MVANDKPTRLPVDSHDGEMAELPLLLPIWQVEELERMANAEGATIGQILRRLVHSGISRHRAGHAALYPNRH